MALRTASDPKLAPTKMAGRQISRGDIENIAHAVFRGIFNIEGDRIVSLSADKIDAGFLDADRIDARTLRVDKLMIGSLDNLIQNPGFEDGVTTPLSVDQDGGGGNWLIGVQPRSGAHHLAYQIPSGGMGANAVVTLNGDPTSRELHVAVAEGDIFYFEAWARSAALVGGSAGARLQIRYRAADGTEISGSTGSLLSLTGTYQKISMRTEAPAGTAYVIFRLVVLSSDVTATSGSIRFDDCYARRQVGTLVIEDLAVDIDRLLEPISVVTDNNKDVDLNFDYTTFQPIAGVTLTLPSWAGTVNALGNGHLTASDSSGSTRTARVRVAIGGVSGDFLHTVIGNSDTKAVSASHARTIAAPGSTLNFQTEAEWTSTGTGTANAAISAIAVVER